VNLRHATALALVGWYLMLPPGRRGEKVAPDFSAPLSEWSIYASFDSARDCEKAKTDFQVQMQQGRATHDAVADFPKLLAASIACVSTDDPRLKEK
jgi:hypothetical protein